MAIMTMSIIQLSKQNIDQAAKTLYLAFRNDPLMLWMFDGQDNYDQKAPWAIKSWIKWSMLYGVAIATPNCEAVAIRKKPGKHDFSLWSVIRAGMWRTSFVLGKTIDKKLMSLDKIMHEEQVKNMGSDQFWYLWLIGTHPDFRQQGHAKKLLNYTFDLAHHSQLPCYLETATTSNVTMHQKMGFKLLSTIKIPDSTVELYCMAKDAR